MKIVVIEQATIELDPRWPTVSVMLELVPILGLNADFGHRKPPPIVVDPTPHPRYIAGANIGTAALFRFTPR